MIRVSIDNSNVMLIGHGDKIIAIGPEPDELDQFMLDVAQFGAMLRGRRPDVQADPLLPLYPLKTRVVTILKGGPDEKW